MTKELDMKFTKEHKTIVKYVFCGYSTMKIAKLMNYSRTSISNKINFLFKKYNVKNRIEFVSVVLGEIILEYKKKLYKNEIELSLAKRKLNKIINLLDKISFEFKKENFEEISSLLNKITIYVKN